MSGPVKRAAERARKDTHALRGKALEAVGGPARARVVLTFAAILALAGADTGTISPLAGNLEQAFHIGNTEFGLLLTVVSLAGAAFTIPFGVLTDRTRRTRLLTVCIAAWAVAVLFSGAAQSYLWLVLARVGLGLVTGVAGPAIASLTGDFFPARERGRMYGMILGGDLIGSALGYIISGDLSSVVSWRYAMWWPMIPSLALAWWVWKLPEPARGGQSALPVGAGHITGEREAGDARHAGESGDARPAGRGHGAASGEDARGEKEGMVQKAARRIHAEPDPDLVLHGDPAGNSVWWAIRYVLRVRTNLVIIIASALGYFFFAGFRAFAILFATRHYGITKPEATAVIVILGAGALAGIFAGGRITDRLLQRGHLRIRVIVPAVCLLGISLFLAPGIATASIAVAVPLFTAGAFLLGAPNPPMDAARLDIIHHSLWGRAEGVRSTLRTLGEAGAPLLFGFVSEYVFGGPGAIGGTGGLGGGAGAAGNAGNATGLEYTFLVFLAALIVAGLLVLPALRTYPRDVATAAASVKAIRTAGGGDERRDDGGGGRDSKVTRGDGKAGTHGDAGRPAA